jgi:hypothetical protein
MQLQGFQQITLRQPIQAVDGCAAFTQCMNLNRISQGVSGLISGP